MKLETSTAVSAAAPLRVGIGAGVVLASLVLGVVLVHAGALRSGHEWSDDYAMYVSHALNLLGGRPYGDTGYVPNPWAVPGPATYPPVYPLLIAPWVARWGADLQMLKILGLVMLGAALLPAYALLRPRTGTGAALALVAMLGFSPFFIEFRDEIRPDTTFLFFFLSTLVLGERWTGSAQTLDGARIAQGALLGLVAYLAYGTRSVGIVLLPALALLELWRLRRLGPVLWTALAVWLAFAAVQSTTLHADAAYARLLTLDPHTLAYNAWKYTASLALLWNNGLDEPWGRALRALLAVTSGSLAVVGYVSRIRHGPTVLEIVPWLYMLPLLVFWVGTMIQQRYMLPLFPIFLYYAWVGLDTVQRRLTPRWRSVLLLALGAGVASSYISAYARQDAGEIQPGISNPAAAQVFAYVREQTPADAVLLVGRARAFALYGQRRSVSPYGFRTDAELWRLIAEHDISHVVVGLGALALEMDSEHPADLERFIAANGQRLRLVFANGEFEIHAVALRPQPVPRRGTP